MDLRIQKHQKFVTKDEDGQPNGYLIPIYNINDGFFSPGTEPKQVYLTVVSPGKYKGPHLHFIRKGFFTCIRGNIKIIIKSDGEYKVFFSGESFDYASIEVPIGVPAVIQNIGIDEAFVLNMPNPAWTPEMQDEHTADFSDYDFDLKEVN